MMGPEDLMARPQTKTVKASQTEMTELVLPNDTNLLGPGMGTQFPAPW